MANAAWMIITLGKIKENFAFWFKVRFNDLPGTVLVLWSKCFTVTNWKCRMLVFKKMNVSYIVYVVYSTLVSFVKKNHNLMRCSSIAWIMLIFFIILNFSVNIFSHKFYYSICIAETSELFFFFVFLTFLFFRKKKYNWID